MYTDRYGICFVVKGVGATSSRSSLEIPTTAISANSARRERRRKRRMQRCGGEPERAPGGGEGVERERRERDQTVMGYHAPNLPGTVCH
jgi:hypothetical protein